MNSQKNNYELIKFEDGEFSLDVTVSPIENTVWLTQKQMAELYKVSSDNIGLHIKNILKEKELDDSTTEESSVVQIEGKRKVKRKTKIYNLDMIISVGYRVNSKRGILFRKWAASVLKQYMMNGYSLNEKRCLECHENLISLNNKVNILVEHDRKHSQEIKNLSNLDVLLKDKLFYENEIFDAYSYIKQLFLSATTSIIIIDGYVDLSVLDMLNAITIPITIYTYPNANLTKQDIEKFSICHTLKMYRTSLIHDRFIIIDSTIYSVGTSIKDVGKKRFVMTKIESISVNDLLKNVC